MANFAGVPTFSPRDLRHRRITLLHEQGVSWARIGEAMGHGDIATTARTYTHVGRRRPRARLRGTRQPMRKTRLKTAYHASQ